MSMTGGISFFDENLAAFADGARCVASSNNDNANLILGRDDFFIWQSSGSDDTTTETLTINLPVSTVISRLFILGHNLKDFEISVTGANLTGLNSKFNLRNNGNAPEATLTGGDIDQNNYDSDVSYYEFDAVAVTEIVITCTTTQIADAQKTVSQIILTNEIGTMRGFPETRGVRIDPNQKREQTISGYSHIQRGVDTVDFNLNLRSYPYQDDIDLLDTLFGRVDPFLVWMCGGLPDQFKINSRGWRARDIYQMKVDGNIENGFDRNVYSLGAVQQYSFREVIS